MTYSHEGTHGLEPATSKLGPSVTANGAGDVEDGQPMTNHHDCHFLGKQPPFACRNGYYVAAVAVHTKDHTVKGLLAYVNFGHGEHGHLQHAPDCEQRDCFVVQGKRQETNTGARPKLPDHYRCTITCAFCGKRKHYEDECYHKQRLSAKLKGKDPGKGSGKGGGKSNGNDAGKGKLKGRGKGQEKSLGGPGGGANRQPNTDNKNPDKKGGNPNPNPGVNSEPSGGQSGPTTCSQTQAQREQGAKGEHEGDDDGNAKK